MSVWNGWMIFGDFWNLDLFDDIVIVVEYDDGDLFWLFV